MKSTKELVSDLERALGTNCEEIPPGFRLAIEWAKIWGNSPTTAKNLIKIHIKNGRMERKLFKHKDSYGKTRQDPFYKAIK